MDADLVKRSRKERKDIRKKSIGFGRKVGRILKGRQLFILHKDQSRGICFLFLRVEKQSNCQKHAGGILTLNMTKN